MDVLLVFGTRPEAIKMAPVYRALREGPLRPIVAVTAQHREMLDQVLELFQIPVAYDLNIMREGQSLTQVTGLVLGGLAQVLEEVRPRLVLVHGDTTTTFAASLAAFYQQIPVGHVEAGLRSHDPYNPYPEEMNRRLTGSLAALHFCPTPLARENLCRESVAPDRIYVTGNTVIDALLSIVEEDYQFQEPTLRSLDFAGRRVLVATAHRRENWGGPLRDIMLALKDLADRFPDVEVVFPVHRNPQVREPAQAILGGAPRVHLIPPLPYGEFANLLARCHLVLTDSGGLQEEAPALGKPVLVLREKTERPEGVAAGTVRLAGTRRETVLQEAERLLVDSEEYGRMARAVNPYGDGMAAARIHQALLHYFGLGERPLDFRPGEEG